MADAVRMALDALLRNGQIEDMDFLHKGCRS